jgi:hypothetical protein
MALSRRLDLIKRPRRYGRMKKMLAKSLLVIIEAGIDVLVERIKKRGNKNGNHDGLENLSDSRGAYDLCGRSAARLQLLSVQRAVTKKRWIRCLHLEKDRIPRKEAHNECKWIL